MVQVPLHPSQAQRRIANRVRIPSGTATVSAEAARMVKAGHWSGSSEKAVRGCGCVSQETCLNRWLVHSARYGVSGVYGAGKRPRQRLLPRSLFFRPVMRGRRFPPAAVRRFYLLSIRAGGRSGAPASVFPLTGAGLTRHRKQNYRPAATVAAGRFWNFLDYFSALKPSFRPTERLKTRCPGAESLLSRQK